MDRYLGFILKMPLVSSKAGYALLSVPEFEDTILSAMRWKGHIDASDVYEAAKDVAFPMMKTIYIDVSKSEYKRLYGKSEKNLAMQKVKALRTALNELSDALYHNRAYWKHEMVNYINECSDINLTPQQLDDIFEKYNQRKKEIFVPKEDGGLDLAKLYDQVMRLRNDDDYELNQSQMDKFVEVAKYFSEMAQRCNGRVDPIVLRPKEMCGGLTATFVVFHVYGDNIERFCNVIKHCSAVSIDGNEAGIVISITVPNVFVQKKN